MQVNQAILDFFDLNKHDPITWVSMTCGDCGPMCGPMCLKYRHKYNLINKEKKNEFVNLIYHGATEQQIMDYPVKIKKSLGMPEWLLFNKKKKLA